MPLKKAIFYPIPLLALLAASAFPCEAAGRSSGYVPLFDGKTLDGWTLIGKAGPGYVPKDGILVCPADGGGPCFILGVPPALGPFWFACDDGLDGSEPAVGGGAGG